MKPTNPHRVISSDTALADGSDEVLSELPFTLDEVNDLVYSDERPAGERVGRLQELAEDLRARQAGDLADGDPASLLREVEDAIRLLETKSQFVGEPGMLDGDPLDHRETLSPDSDELELIEEEDEESLEDENGESDPDDVTWVEDDPPRDVH
jgi:hypothetical protein